MFWHGEYVAIIVLATCGLYPDISFLIPETFQNFVGPPFVSNRKRIAGICPLKIKHRNAYWLSTTL